LFSDSAKKEIIKKYQKESSNERDIPSKGLLIASQ
jgi:hypothetical protein